MEGGTRQANRRAQAMMMLRSEENSALAEAEAGGALRQLPRQSKPSGRHDMAAAVWERFAKTGPLACFLPKIAGNTSFPTISATSFHKIIQTFRKQGRPNKWPALPSSLFISRIRV
jgi:hypothetical protein